MGWKARLSGDETVSRRELCVLSSPWGAGRCTQVWIPAVLPTALLSAGERRLQV